MRDRLVTSVSFAPSLNGTSQSHAENLRRFKGESPKRTYAVEVSFFIDSSLAEKR